MKYCQECNKELSGYQKTFCSEQCRFDGGKKQLREFNHNRIGKRYEDFYKKNVARRTKQKISKATHAYSLKTGRIPPSRKGVKSRMPVEFFRKIGSLSVLSQSKKRGYTSIEKKIYQYLQLNNVLFKKQYLINNHFVVDAYIPSLNLVIEADGEYWHSLEKNKKKDKAKTAYLIKCGYDLLRLSEAEINNDSFIQKLAGRFGQCAQ